MRPAQGLSLSASTDRRSDSSLRSRAGPCRRIVRLKQFSKHFILFLLVADILLTFSALYMAEVVREIAPVRQHNTGMTFLSPAILPTVALIWGFFLTFFGAYDPRRLSSFLDEGRAILLAILAGMLVLSSFFYLFNIEYRSRMLFAYFAVIDLLLLVNYRLLVRYLVRSMVASGYNTRRVVSWVPPR